MRTPLASVLAAVLALLLLAPSVAAEIMLSKSTASVGESVRITILPALQDQTLLVLAPNATYRFIGGIAEDTVFIPQQEGEHIIHLLEANTLVESATFIVEGAGTADDTPAVLPLVASTEVSTGLPIIINAPTLNVVEVSVSHGSERFSSRDSRRPITYVPEEPGVYDIAVLYANGTTESLSVTALGPASPYKTAQEAPAALQAPQGQFSMPTTERRMRLQTADGRLVNANLVWRRNGTIIKQTASAIFDPQTLDPGVYDLEVSMPGRSIKTMRFKGLRYAPDAMLGVEELDPEMITGAPPATTDAFGIDPSMLQFETAQVTFTASASALYKCVQYNFTTRTCHGENVKVMDLVPGQQYTFEMNSTDPLYSQTGYLANPNFDASIGSWTTLSEGTDPVTFSWVATDTPQSGVAAMTISGANKNGFGNYYQTFTLTIPQGTTLAGINFSAMWRMSTYNSQAGSVNFWIQNSARTTTYCSINRTFSSTTTWATETINTGSGGCNLASFTPGTTYTFRLRCNLNTGAGGGSSEVCRWDNTSIIAWYNDTTAPAMRDAQETPDPVSYGNPLNITVNVTDNVNLDTVRIELLGTNYTMLQAPGSIFYYSGFNTARSPGVYYYRIYANDTNGNMLANTSTLLNFTIRDINPPLITLLSPAAMTYTTNASFIASYSLDDQVGVNNCSLNVSGTIRNSTLTNPLGTTLNLTAPLATDGRFLWNITCNDTSNNRNTSETRTIVRDTVAPAVFLNNPNSWVTSNASVRFNITPQDLNLANCTLWSNLSGAWSANETLPGPINASPNLFTAITLADGTYLWNAQCRDLAGNSAFNATNYTITIDTDAPDWSGISLGLANGTTYAPGAAYQFNITWTDERSNVSSVLFETNFSGVSANVTPAKSGNTYSYTFTDRPAGAYAYRWYANDSAGNTNSTAQNTYVISQAVPTLNLTLNGSSQNMLVGIDEYINMTGRLLTPSQGTIELLLDSVRINVGQNIISNTTQLSQERRYNITLRYNATQNYTSSQVTLFADVIDTTPPVVALGNPQNNSLQPTNITFFFTPYDNVDIGNCTIVLDGVRNATKDVSSGSGQNISVQNIPDGTHNWTVNCTDTSNNTYQNTSLKYFTVDTIAPGAFSLTSPASGGVAADLTPTFIWQQSSDANFAHYTIMVDNDVNFGSINYEANRSPLTNTSASFTVLDQTVWYWRVVAYDQAGNLQASSQVFNYTADATPPSVSLTSPADGTHTNNTAVNVTYTATDFTRLANCSLHINGVRNRTNTSVSAGANFFLVTLPQDTYNWTVACIDQANNTAAAQNRTLTIDTTAPAAFDLLGPPNNTLSADNLPTYTWNASSDQHFSHYEVQVSDTAGFTSINHSLSAVGAANTSATQPLALSDGTWYWRVIAYDQAGNARSSGQQRTYKVDTTLPAAFDLLTPSNGVEERNDTPLFTWQQSSDANFKNYTLQISDRADFGTINATSATLASTLTSIALGVARNVPLFWRVIAYDNAGLSTNSTSTFTYLADYTNPVVAQVSPAAGTTITGSSLVPFRFNVTDVGTIANCSLYINGTLDKTVNSPAKGTTLTLSSSLENGNYNWYVACTDMAGNTGASSTRALTLNVQVPTQRLYESTPGATTFASTATINLTYTPDASENSVSYSVAGTSVATAVEAKMTLNGSGMIIFNNTLVNFSGVFAQSNNNIFFVTWKLYKQNGTGNTLICQSGNDNNGGTAVGSTTKKTLTGSCTNTAGEVRFNNGDQVSLVVNVYNDGGNARTFTHYWEGTSSSFVAFSAYKLGTISASFSNLTNPLLPESTAYVERCIIGCADGTCVNTDVYLQLYNGTQWLNVSTEGNITLNSTQLNPVTLGNINATTTVNVSLYGNEYSAGNRLRCVATSAYGEATSAEKTVSVTDVTAPAVTLNSPSTGIAIEPQEVTMRYTPFDVRLANCTLWGNWSGGWSAKETHTSPINGSENAFSPTYLDYGFYKWNVQCFDSAGNSAFASSNHTINVAGDLALTSGNITFSPQSPVEGQNTTIYANITNRANKSEPSVKVQFWDGDPSAGGTEIGNTTIALTPLGRARANITWTATIGLHNIYVVIDPPLGSGVIVESDETNNIANRSLLIGMWQVYYGNVTGLFTLGASANSTFANWTLTNTTGNIYITDTDTRNGIQFQFLQPLGRGSTGIVDANSQDDFNEADILLGAGGYIDNINRTYTLSGAPVSTEVFSIFGRTVANTAVVNSSTDGNFTTGVLWDSDDSANSFYDAADAEDIVFVAKIHDATVSAHGVVDYEMRIPSRLKSYRGTTETVSFYYEIQ